MHPKSVSATLPLGKTLKPSFEETALAELEVLYRVAKRLTLDEAFAEDLVGQTLLRAVNGWHTFDGRFPRGWLLGILQNVYRREVANLARRPALVALNERDASPSDVYGEVVGRFVGERIFTELGKLPEDYRLAVALCDVESLSYAEAAIAMGVPQGTVKSRLWRGRRLLRQRLAGLDSEYSC